MPTTTASADAVLLQQPSVSTITPTSGATGVALGQNVIVVFDTAVDKDSVTKGHFIITQSANVVAPTGPGLFDELLTGKLVTTNLLTTPTFTGTVAGTITWSADFLTFTLDPTELLSANQVYTVLLSDEIVSQTLTDPIAGGGNTGTGTMNVVGPYTGTWVADTYTITITTGGTLTNAVFKWSKASEGIDHTGIVVDRSIDIEDNGLVLKFGAGVYDLNDTFTFDATEGIPLNAITQFTFTTGSPTMVTPSTQAQSNEVILEEVGGITQLTSTPTPASVGFKVLSIDPALRATDLDLTQKLITITFNKDLDAATIDNDSVEVLLETLPADHNARMSEPLSKKLTVSGPTLTISLDGV